MFKRIIVVYDASPESSRALASAIRLAKMLGSELHALTICEAPAGSSSFVTAAARSLTKTLASDQRDSAERRLANARAMAGKHGVELAAHLVEGQRVESIVSCINKCKADLLVVGLHQQSLYVSRLWSAVYPVALESPCRVLGVH